MLNPASDERTQLSLRCPLASCTPEPVRLLHGKVTFRSSERRRARTLPQLPVRNRLIVMRVRCVLFTQINDSDYPMYWRAYTALNAIR